MNKKILTAVLGIVLLIPDFTNAQAPDWVWAKSMSGNLSEEGNSIKLDAAGNIYTTGYFSDTVDFDPGPGVYNLIPDSIGTNDIFITKSDNSGNLIWAKKLGGIKYDVALSIAVDSFRNVFTTGYFMGTADFDPGIGVYNLTSAGNNTDIFICKLNTIGNFVWAKKFGSTAPYNDEGNFITVDEQGNVYTTGYFRSTVDFDPSASTYNLTASGIGDIFILKLTNSGNFVWARKFGSNLLDEGESLTVDHLGNVFATGYFQNTVDFDPGAGVYNLWSGGGHEAVFVLKLNSSGNFVWAKHFNGTANNSRGNSIAVDNSGSVLTTGYFNELVDFDPDSSGTYTLWSNYNANSFVSKLDSLGNFVWAKDLGGTAGYSQGNSLTLDSDDNIYTAGFFSGLYLDFDPDTALLVYYNLSTWNWDVFISKLNSSGVFVWAKSFGGDNYAYGKAITVDASENVYLTGSFKSQNLIINTDTLINSDNTVSTLDIFTAKLLSCSSTTDTINVAACNSYASPSGNTFTSSGTYIDLIPNAAGCDSVITINLTINSTSSTQTIAACNSFNSPSGNYIWTTSGAHMDTIPNAAGCDSVLTINLTINTVTASYTLYPDPDTTQLHHWFAIANVTGAPTAYLWNWGDGNTDTGATPSHTYSAPGFYNICLSITDANGCTDTYCDSSTYISKTEEERLIITINVVTQLPNGIATVTTENNNLFVTPNPCTLCEITGAVTATDLMVTDILGRNQLATFSKSANGFYIHFAATSPGIFLIRNIKTGEVVKFVRE